MGFQIFLKHDFDQVFELKVDEIRYPILWNKSTAYIHKKQKGEHKMFPFF